AAPVRGAPRTAKKFVLAPRRADVLVNEPGSVDGLLVGLAPACQVGSVGPDVPGIALDEDVSRHGVSPGPATHRRLVCCVMQWCKSARLAPTLQAPAFRFRCCPVVKTGPPDRR